MTNFSIEKLIKPILGSSLIIFTTYLVIRKHFLSKWIKICQVEKLIIYPVKSLRGVEVDHLKVSKGCLKYNNHEDRSFLLLDEDGKCVTLRSEPLLYNIKIELDGDYIVLNAENMNTLRLFYKYDLKNGDSIYKTSIWGSEIEGVYVGDEASNFFRKFLNNPNIKLIKHIPKLGYRPSNQIINEELNFIKKKKITFQDENYCLLINRRSVEDLNEKIHLNTLDDQIKSIHFERFRPNIVFKTKQPFEEDNWKYVKIGNNQFEFIMRCGRCKMTTLNSNTLEYEEEPLKTLRKYRLGSGKIEKNCLMMGIYITPLEYKTIHSNDDINVIYF